MRPDNSVSIHNVDHSSAGRALDESRHISTYLLQVGAQGLDDGPGVGCRVGVAWAEGLAY